MNKVCLLLIVLFSLSLMACNSKGPYTDSTSHEVKPAMCPLPQALPSEDKNQIKDFGLKIADAFKKIVDLEIKAKIENQTKIDFPDAANVNRIFALTYAACVACNMEKIDRSSCARYFDSLIAKFPPSPESGSLLDEAILYKRDLIDPMLQTQ